METPLLAAALIVKDEEDSLPGCLDSIASLGDLCSEVCIYDTGSTDSTVRIAESWGARVQLGYWDADFSRARNEAIAMTTAKWVLILDADERIHAKPRELGHVLRRLLSTGMVGFDACTVELSNRDVDGRETNVFPSQRLFRPARGRYHKRIHELPGPHVDGAPWRIATIERRVAYVTHHGYVDASALEARGERNSRSALLDVEELRAQGASAERLAEAMINHARSVMLTGDIEPAMTEMREVRRLDTDSPYRRWAAEYLALLHVARGEWEDAAAAAREFRDEGGDPELADWRLAKARTGQGRHREALDLLRRINRPRDTTGTVAPIAEVLDAHMQTAARCGEFDEALACAIALTAGHGMVEGRGRLLLRLWGGRPPQLLAQLLDESDRGHRTDLVRELDACPEPGPGVARLLKELAQRQAKART